MSNAKPVIEDLSQAAFSGDIKAVDKILSEAVNINFFDEDGSTPLFSSVISLNPIIVDKMLRAGADPNLGDDEMAELPIMRVVSHVYYSPEGKSIFDMLLDAGVNIDLQTRYGETVLMRAARFGTVKAVRELIKHGANADLVDNAGKRAIGYARLGLSESTFSNLDGQHKECIILLESGDLLDK